MATAAAAPARRSAAHLAVGERVFVESHKCRGIIKFTGQTNFAEGEWMGVELDTPGGKNDGSVKGVSYFTCKPNHGLFVRISALSREDAKARATSTPRKSALQVKLKDSPPLPSPESPGLKDPPRKSAPQAKLKSSLPPSPDAGGPPRRSAPARGLGVSRSPPPFPDAPDAGGAREPGPSGKAAGSPKLWRGFSFTDSAGPARSKPALRRGGTSEGLGEEQPGGPTGALQKVAARTFKAAASMLRGAQGMRQSGGEPMQTVDESGEGEAMACASAHSEAAGSDVSGGSEAPRPPGRAASGAGLREAASLEGPGGAERLAAQWELAVASEEHDPAAIKAALQRAQTAGVDAAEIASAQRVLGHEMQGWLAREIEGLCGTVQRLKRTVDAMEARANAADSRLAAGPGGGIPSARPAALGPASGGGPDGEDAWLSSLGQQLERRVWEGLERRVEAAVRDAAARAAREALAAGRPPSRAGQAERPPPDGLAPSEARGGSAPSEAFVRDAAARAAQRPPPTTARVLAEPGRAEPPRPGPRARLRLLLAGSCRSGALRAGLARLRPAAAAEVAACQPALWCESRLEAWPRPEVVRATISSALRGAAVRTQTVADRKSAVTLSRCCLRLLFESASKSEPRAATDVVEAAPAMKLNGIHSSGEIQERARDIVERALDQACGRRMEAAGARAAMLQRSTVRQAVADCDDPSVGSRRAASDLGDKWTNHLQPGMNEDGFVAVMRRVSPTPPRARLRASWDAQGSRCPAALASTMAEAELAQMPVDDHPPLGVDGGDAAAARIQAVFRGSGAKQAFRRKQDAATRIQAAFRGNGAKKALRQRQDDAARVKTPRSGVFSSSESS